MPNLAASLIVCGTSNPSDHPCGFSDLITLARAVMTDLTLIATFLVVVAAIMIGYTLLTSQGSTTAKENAKDMAWKVLWGYIWILVAWLLVYTISSALLAPGFSLLTGLK